MKTIALATYSSAPALINEDQPLIPILKKLNIEAVPLNWETNVLAGVDAVVLRSCWNNHLKPEKFAAWISALQTPLWNPAQVVLWNQDKSHLLDLQAKGVLLPRTLLLPAGTANDRADLIAASGLNEFVIKPTISASAHGTFRFKITDKLGLNQALCSLPESSPLLLQEFIPAILSEGEISFIFFNGKYSHSVLKKTKPGDFRVQEDFGGTRQTFSPTDALVDEARELLHLLGGLDWLYARVDTVLVDRRLLLMEIEAIDPMLYFAWADGARERFAQAIADRI